MPWESKSVMLLRDEFIAAHSTGLFTVTQLCGTFGISRKTGYKWINRNREEGIEGLLDRKRTRETQHKRTPDDVRAAIINCRMSHPKWGGRKILCYLRNKHLVASDRLPCAATASSILSKAGLITPRRRRQRSPHPGSFPLVAAKPNDVWTIDFKGEFKTADGIVCYPLTVQDAATRYLLMCKALPNTRTEGAMAALEELFRKVGMPAAIRSDNGSPFCSPAIAGLSRLSIWWLKLGIRHDRIRPSSPQENGRHERFHRTLKAETVEPRELDHAHQQVRFNKFQQEYNHERPHEAIGDIPPGTLWVASERKYPETLMLPEYPAHMYVRSVRTSGEFKLKGKLIFLSEALVGEKIGLEETEYGIWSISYYNLLLAKLNEQDMKIIKCRPSRNQRSSTAIEQIDASEESS